MPIRQLLIQLRQQPTMNIWIRMKQQTTTMNLLLLPNQDTMIWCSMIFMNVLSSEMQNAKEWRVMVVTNVHLALPPKKLSSAVAPVHTNWEIAIWAHTPKTCYLSGILHWWNKKSKIKQTKSVDWKGHWGRSHSKECLTTMELTSQSTRHLTIFSTMNIKRMWKSFWRRM